MRCWWKHYAGVFTPQECAEIVHHGLQLPAREATVILPTGKCDVTEQQRSATVRFIDRADWTMAPIYARLAKHFLLSNQQCFGVDAGDFHQVQLATYTPGHGHHCWHEDSQWIQAENSSVLDRKLTLIVQLSHADDYTGGELRLDRGGLADGLFKQGDVIVFPSVLKHKVEAVTAGVRHSLATWAIGPRWR